MRDKSEKQGESATERERGVRRFSANSINPVTADPRRGKLEHLWPCTFSSSDTQFNRHGSLAYTMFAIIRNYYSRIKAKTCQTYIYIHIYRRILESVESPEEEGNPSLRDREKKVQGGGYLVPGKNRIERGSGEKRMRWRFIVI